MKIKTKKMSKKILAGAFALSLAFPLGNLTSNNAKAGNITYPEPVVGTYKNLAWLDKQNTPSFRTSARGVGWEFSADMNELSYWAGYKVMSVDDPRVYEGLTEENKEVVKNYPQETDKFDKYFDYILINESSVEYQNEKKEKLKYPNYSTLLMLLEVEPGHKIEDAKRELINIIYVDPTDRNFHWQEEYNNNKAEWYKIKNNAVEKYKKDVNKQLVVLNKLDKIRLQIENNPELDKDLVVSLNTRTAFFKGEEHKKGEWKENEYGRWYVYQDGTYPRGETVVIDGVSYTFDIDGYLSNNVSSSSANNNVANNNTTNGSSKIASWQSNSTGWWYQNADGSYPANEWQQIDGSWYYFNESGYMVASIWIGNYYLGENGAMLTNTTTPDGYVVGSDGAWIA